MVVWKKRGAQTLSQAFLATAGFPSPPDLTRGMEVYDHDSMHTYIHISQYAVCDVQCAGVTVVWVRQAEGESVYCPSDHVPASEPQPDNGSLINITEHR